VLQGLTRVTLRIKVTCAHSHKKVVKELFYKIISIGQIIIAFGNIVNCLRYTAGRYFTFDGVWRWRIVPGKIG